MSLYLRIIGITNAALWFGSAFLMAVVVWPAFSSSEVLRILPRPHAGAVGQVLFEKYFVVQCWCGGIALLHLLVDWLYGGKPLRRWMLTGVVALLAWALASGLWLQPKLKELHLDLYGIRSTPQQRQRAAGSYPGWQSVMEGSNVAMAIALGIFVWEISSAGTTARFVRRRQYQGLTNSVS